VDLLDYLRESWLASNPNVDDLSEGQIELLLGDFIKHARQMLRDNLPVGMDYLSDVPSLRFQDATTLPIVKVENVSQMAESTGSFPIAKQPKVAPGVAFLGCDHG